MYFKVCISGLTAVGKTSLASQLVERYRAEYLSASKILLKLAREKEWIGKGAEATDHFWLREAGEAFFREREASLELDREVDEKLLNTISSPQRSVIDSLSVPLLLPSRISSFSVLLQANLVQRVERAWLSSPTMSKKALRQGVKEKDERTEQLLEALWGINILRPPIERYDLVIRDTHLEAVVGRGRGKKSQREIEVKLRILFAFLDVYEQIVQPTLSRRKISSLVARCRRTYEHYKAIIRRFPRSFFALRELDQMDWEQRNIR